MKCVVALAMALTAQAFAPTDDAFAALPAGTVESLLLPENLASPRCWRLT